MRFVALSLLVSCAGATGLESPSSPRSDGLRDAGLSKLLAARDQAGVLAMLDGKVGFGGAWFDDATCRAQLPMAVTISSANLPALARCIATLRLEKAERTSMHPDIALVAYGPGIELEVRFVGSVGEPRLQWIGFVSRTSAADALPTITQSAFEAARIDPRPIDLDSATRAKVDAELVDILDVAKRAYSWFKICVDAEGTVTSVKRRGTSSLVAQRAFADALRTWKLRPFMLGSQPSAPVCSLVRVGDASTAREPAIPLTPIREGAIYVSPWLAGRIGGVGAFTPDDPDKTRIQRRGGGPIRGMFHACFTTDGEVETIQLLHSTGLPGFDRKIANSVRRWRYRPIEIDGTAVPACTMVTVVYSQR